MNQRTKENILWLPTIFATAMLLAIIFWAQDALDHTRNKVAIYKLQKAAVLPTNFARYGMTEEEYYYFVNKINTKHMTNTGKSVTNRLHWTNVTNTTLDAITSNAPTYRFQEPESGVASSFRANSDTNCTAVMFLGTNGFKLAIGANQCFGEFGSDSRLFIRHMAANGPTNTNIQWTDTNGTVWIPKWERIN